MDNFKNIEKTDLIIVDNILYIDEVAAIDGISFIEEKIKDGRAIDLNLVRKFTEDEFLEEYKYY